MQKSHRDYFLSFTGGRYIDPETVGSGISWKFSAEAVTRDPDHPDTNYISSSGEIALSDCSRWITWGFDLDEPESLDKLDAAIAELQEARRKLALAIKRVQAKRIALGIKE